MMSQHEQKQVPAPPPDVTQPFLPQLKEAKKLAIQNGMRVLRFRLGGAAWSLLEHEQVFGSEPPAGDEERVRPPPPPRPAGTPVKLFGVPVTRDLMVEWVELDLQREMPVETRDLRQVLSSAGGASGGR